MTEPGSVAVVLVNYNGGSDIVDCLRSVLAQDGVGEVVVVDNASTDGSAQRVESLFSEVKVLHNAENMGFAAAANRGVRASTTPVVVLLNPDARVDAGVFTALATSIAQRPRAAAVGPLVRNPDGSIQPSKRSFPTLWQSLLHGLVGLVWPQNPGSRAYLLSDASLDEPTQVGWVSASAVAMRREAFDAVDGFDEGYFFFVEDVDLCRRFWDAGWEVWFDPRAEVIHAWGGSWTQRPLRFLWLHQWNLFRYVRKHRRGWWVAAYPVIAAGLVVRFLLLALRWIVVRRSVPAHRGS